MNKTVATKTNYTPKTHCENGKFFGRILLPNGFDYYIGPFNSRSTARRKVLRTNKSLFTTGAA